jgi:hypothetical protein
MKKICIIIIFCIHSSVLLIGQTGGGRQISAYTSQELFLVHARLVNKITGAGAPGIRGFVSIPGIHFEMRTELSDSSGNLFFLMQDIDGAKQLIFQVQSTENNNYRFEFPAPFITKYPLPKLPVIPQTESDTLPFYGKADKVYLLDDYVRFPTLEEVIREYISEVRLLKVRDQFGLSVMNIPFHKYFDNNPLILLDGVPVSDINHLLALDPLRIKKLEIMAGKYYFGSLICDGIVSFCSYKGDFAGYTLPEEAVVKDINNQKNLK